jgi:UDP-glucose 4-epimerase
VAGEGVIVLSHAIRYAQAVAVPIPPMISSSFVRALSQVSGLNFPPYLIEYFKYPVIVNDDPFRASFGYQPKVKTVQSLKNLGPVSERKIVAVKATDDVV